MAAGSYRRVRRRKCVALPSPGQDSCCLLYACQCLALHSWLVGCTSLREHLRHRSTGRAMDGTARRLTLTNIADKNSRSCCSLFAPTRSGEEGGGRSYERQEGHQRAAGRVWRRGATRAEGDQPGRRPRGTRQVSPAVSDMEMHMFEVSCWPVAGVFCHRKLQALLLPAPVVHPAPVLQLCTHSHAPELPTTELLRHHSSPFCIQTPAGLSCTSST